MGDHGTIYKVVTKKINFDVLGNWIQKKIENILGVEDEVTGNFVLQLLQDKENPDPKEMILFLIPVLERDATFKFMEELWRLLISASDTLDGIPPELVEEKAEMERKIELENRKRRILSQPQSRTDPRYNSRQGLSRPYYPPNSAHQNRQSSNFTSSSLMPPSLYASGPVKADVGQASFNFKEFGMAAESKIRGDYRSSKHGSRWGTDRSSHSSRFDQRGDMGKSELSKSSDEPAKDETTSEETSSESDSRSKAHKESRSKMRRRRHRRSSEGSLSSDSNSSSSSSRGRSRSRHRRHGRRHHHRAHHSRTDTESEGSSSSSESSGSVGSGDESESKRHKDKRGKDRKRRDKRSKTEKSKKDKTKHEESSSDDSEKPLKMSEKEKKKRLKEELEDEEGADDSQSSYSSLSHSHTSQGQPTLSHRKETEHPADSLHSSLTQDFSVKEEKIELDV
eukprot:MONOS_5121.1-p1 / transcript=MONOS_5121.1 / gene=MONOS_5121 / organism=Monocercomonoides_exilis_PA203 / gene_product=unspecified product / transcript_product=unspecified product / location=Mono_scaffold00145:86268-87979(+) / protein_length=451 / sequence_SO=supercontig / SO=protein_coding / is_pseudo=false